MKRIFLLSSLAATAALLLASCTESSNVNSNSNRASNANSSVTNTVANTAANVANTVANAVSSVTTPAPDTFLRDATQDGMAEVEMAKLAAKNAKDPEVKKFAQMMVADHTKLGNDLKALAQKKNIELPADMGSNKSTVDDLTKLTGAEFDAEFVSEMVDAHEDDLAAFQKQADNSEDADLKALAAKAVTVIKKHLDAIKAIQTKMDNAK